MVEDVQHAGHVHACRTTGLTGRQPRPASAAGPMIDLFALALTHGLLLLMVLRLMRRDDLDREPKPDPDAVAEADRKP